MGLVFENHGGPCTTRCERIACMCAHEKLAAELKALLDAERQYKERLTNAGKDILLLSEERDRLAAVAAAAPRYCICHVASYDGYYGANHSDKCKALSQAFAILDQQSPADEEPSL